MKKISLFVFAGMLAFACAKSPVDLEIHTSPIQEEPEVVKKGRTANIVMYADVDREVETKVSATEESGIINFEFDEGDEISAFFKSDECVDKNVKFTYNGSKFVTDEGQSYTTLDGDKMPEVYAIYPYDKGLGSVTDLGKVPVTIPQVQMYGSYTSNPYFPKQYARFMAVPSALKEKDGSYSIETKFYPMGSMVKLQVQNATEGALNIKSVNIYGPDNLSGDFTVDVTKNPAYNSGAEFKLNPDNGGVQYNHVCVSYGSEGKVLNNKGRLTIYAFVNAAAFEEGKGFSITVSTENGTYIADFAGGQRTYGEFARNRRDTYTITLDDNNRKVSEDVARYTDNAGAWHTASSLSDAISNVSSGGIVELLQNAVHGNNTAITISGKKFTLNGNGYTYDISSRVGHAFFTNPEKPTVTDVVFRNIKFKSNETEESSVSYRLLYNCNSASTITLAEGTEIAGIYYNGVNGGIVYNNGTINIDGAKVNNCGVRKNDKGEYGYGGFIYSTGENAVVNFNSGWISNCSSGASGGVFYNVGSSKLNFYNGEISNCSSGASGGVFYNAGNSKLNFYNGEISKCSATNYGGVFYVYSGSEVNFYNGTVSGSSSTSNGRVAYLSGTSPGMNVYGGNISCADGEDDTAIIYGYNNTVSINIGLEDDASSCPIITHKTGRCLFSRGVTKIYGGEFKSKGATICAVSGSGGAAELLIDGGSFESEGSDAVVIQKGNDYEMEATISGGKFKCPKEVSIIKAADGANITLKGGIYSNPNFADVTFPKNKGPKFNDDEIYYVKIDDISNSEAICCEAKGDFCADKILEALNEANSRTSINMVKLNKSCEMSDAFYVAEGRTVTLDLNGETLTENGTKRLNVTAANAKLVITDCAERGTLCQTATNSYIIKMEKGTLQIDKGSLIAADNATASAIYAAGGEFEMNGGTVDGKSGKAINLVDCSRVKVTNGNAIADNYALSITNGNNVNSVDISAGKFISQNSNAIVFISSEKRSSPNVAEIREGVIARSNAQKVALSVTRVTSLSSGTAFNVNVYGGWFSSSNSSGSNVISATVKGWIKVYGGYFDRELQDWCSSYDGNTYSTFETGQYNNEGTPDVIYTHHYKPAATN